MITEQDARGDSIGVTESDYRAHAKAGVRALNNYLFRVNEFTRNEAWYAVQKPWGGITIAMETQLDVNPDSGYALKCCGGAFPWSTLSISFSDDPFTNSLTRESFNARYAEAIKRFAGAPYIGIFRDEDTGLVEFDAVIIVATEQEARDIATYCESLGGAYNFSTGNGVFPYHVKNLYRVGESLRYLSPESPLALDLMSTSKRDDDTHERIENALETIGDQS